ncbi:glycoside hydrolase family 32 protein, partial [Lactobacillus sp. XV13L]|nr:glycoside hydrolase family 32 protein [Lactobacillus sp. XV13L]
PIIKTPPADNTKNFRDPKVWEHDGKYYVVIGSQDQQGLGRLLLYKSADLKSWQYLGAIAHSAEVATEGYMWECPDLFHLDGQDVLMTSPQGIEKQVDKYLNLYQSGYFLGHLDYQKPLFQRSGFHELDQGHDFYAPQTMLAPDGRRILIGWLNMWESKMPEQQDGWAGALTLPRELVYRQHQLYQLPVAEVYSLRQQQLMSTRLEVQKEQVLTQGHSQLELNIQTDLTQLQGAGFSLKFTDAKTQAFIALEYQQANNCFVIRRSDRSDVRLSQLRVSADLKVQIFVDTSSLEIFLNDGESVMTERYYFDQAPTITLASAQNNTFDCTIYQLDPQTNNYQIKE